MLKHGYHLKGVMRPGRSLLTYTAMALVVVALALAALPDIVDQGPEHREKIEPRVLVESAVFGGNESLGQQRRHFIQADNDPVFHRHPVNHLAVTIENQGRLRWIVLGYVANAGDVQLIQAVKQDSQKHGQNKSDPKHEADNVAFVKRFSALGRRCVFFLFGNGHLKDFCVCFYVCRTGPPGAVRHHRHGNVEE